MYNIEVVNFTFLDLSCGYKHITVFLFTINLLYIGIVKLTYLTFLLC